MNEPMVVDGLAALDLTAPHDAAAAVYDQTRQLRLLLRGGGWCRAHRRGPAHPTNLADEGQRVLFTFTGAGIGVLVMFPANLLQKRAAKPARPAPVPLGQAG
jgi:hypothetical protein